MPSLNSLPILRRVGRVSLSYQTKNLGPHKYGCLMGLFPTELCKEITDWTLENIPDYYLSPEGREGQIHTTFLYGFLDSLDEVREPLTQLLREFGPVDIKFADKLSLFKGNKDGDVLKIGIEGEKIHELNRLLKERFPHHEKFKDYLPHITLAYLDPEMGISDKCAAYTPLFLGKVVQITTSQYSDAENNREDIPLISHPNMGIKSAPKDDDGKWVTINGTHVHLDGSGNIDKGPKGATGKKPKAPKVKKSKLSEKKQSDIKEKVDEKLAEHKSVLEGEEGFNQITEEMMDWAVNLSGEEKAALNYYVKSGYSTLNPIFRQDKEKLAEDGLTIDDVLKWKKLDGDVKALDEAIKKAKIPNAVKVFRGVKDVKHLGDLSQLEGKVITDQGYGSTTFRRERAEGFTLNGAIFEITLPKGTSAASIQSVSKADKEFNTHNEAEMLLGRDSSFRISKVDQTTSPITIHAEYV